jgi:hypothetical protein
MMRSMMKYLAIIVLACTMTVISTAALSTAASAENDDLNSLRALIASFEDNRICSSDLAFFLATHNYDVVPRGDHVDLFLGGMNYRLVPNGNAPGLCDILI